MLRASFPMVMSLMVVLAACATENSNGEGTEGPEAEVRGTVAYLERIGLPSGATIEVSIIDVSIPTPVFPVIAETTVRPEGREVPVPFVLRYDPKGIDPRHDYVVKAVIKSGGATLFESPTPTPVITKGNPTEVELLLSLRPRNAP